MKVWLAFIYIFTFWKFIRIKISPVTLFSFFSFFYLFSLFFLFFLLFAITNDLFAWKSDWFDFLEKQTLEITWFNVHKPFFLSQAYLWNSQAQIINFALIILFIYYFWNLVNFLKSHPFPESVLLTFRKYLLSCSFPESMKKMIIRYSNPWKWINLK